MPLLKRPVRTRTKTHTRATLESEAVKIKLAAVKVKPTTGVIEDAYNSSVELQAQLFDSSITARDLWKKTVELSKKISDANEIMKQDMDRMSRLELSNASLVLMLAMMKQNSVMGNIKYALSVASYGIKIAATQAARGLHFAAQKTLAGVVALLKNIEKACKFVFRQIKRALTAVKNAIVFAAQQTAHGLHFAAQKTLAGAMVLLNGLVSLVKAAAELVKDLANCVVIIAQFYVAPAVTAAAKAVKDKATETVAVLKEVAELLPDETRKAWHIIMRDTERAVGGAIRAVGGAIVAAGASVVTAGTDITVSAGIHGESVRSPVRIIAAPVATLKDPETPAAPAALAVPETPAAPAVVHDHDAIEQCTGCQAQAAPTPRAGL